MAAMKKLGLECDAYICKETLTQGRVFASEGSQQNARQTGNDVRND
jgi:hypothetical protein